MTWDRGEYITMVNDKTHRSGMNGIGIQRSSMAYTRASRLPPIQSTMQSYNVPPYIDGTRNIMILYDWPQKSQSPRRSTMTLANMGWLSVASPPSHGMRPGRNCIPSLALTHNAMPFASTSDSVIVAMSGQNSYWPPYLKMTRGTSSRYHLPDSAWEGSVEIALPEAPFPPRKAVKQRVRSWE